MRITGDELEGKAQLDNFIDPKQPYPVIATTSKLMTTGVDAPKLDPADVVRSAYDGIEAGAWEILADELSGQVKAGLAAPIEALYPQLAGSAS